MSNEVNALPAQPTAAEPALEPKTVAKPRFAPTWHRNSYRDCDLVDERKVA